jgi:hypothetical protein
MSKLTYLPFFVAGILFFLCGNESFSQFSMSGELRPRAEYRHGYGDMIYTDEDPAFFISQRARINLDFKTEKFKIFFSLQDVRVWGSTSQLNVSDDFFSAHELWGEYFFTKTFSMKLGRQELVYDNHRIFGNVGWAQQARSHDLVLLKYNKLELVEIHLGLAFNQDDSNNTGTLYTVSNNYKTMQFLWARKEFDKLGVSALILNTGVQNPDTFVDTTMWYSQTFGVYANYKIGTYSINFAGYYQTGKEGTTGLDLSAYYLNAEVTTPLDFGIAPTLGVELISGTDQEELSPTKMNSFTPLFGTNHKFNGHMDYFYVGNHAANVGLTDFYLSAKYKRGIITPYAAFHYFMSSGKILDPADPTSTLSSSLGLEIDLAMGLDMGEYVAFSAGYSHMFATASMEAVKAVGDHGATNNWAWVMLTFTPDFFQKN